MPILKYLQINFYYNHCFHHLLPSLLFLLIINKEKAF
nr:MAG TPA: hypothetical protein [Crassvirales sp.]